MFTLAIENHLGELVELTNNPDYTVTRMDGISPPTANINTGENANFDGSIFNSSKLNSRNIVIELFLERDAEASRINLYKYVKVKKACVVYYKNGLRDVKIAGYVENLDADPFALKEAVQISIICPYPYYSSVADLTENFSDEEPLFEFPMDIDENGVEFSRVILSDQTVVTNGGDVECGMIIEFRAFGDVVNPSIYNAETAAGMKINKTLYNGDVLRICTIKGQKSVVYIHNGVQSNALNSLDRGSVWLTLESGDNVIAYTADSGESDLVCALTYNTLFEGV